MSYTGDASSLGSARPYLLGEALATDTKPAAQSHKQSASKFAQGTVLLGGLQALGFEGSIEARVDASGVQLEYLALVGLG